ncbi:unnamed protein product [Linum tenue]|nr:unnamed protein product [Linum tenue]
MMTSTNTPARITLNTSGEHYFICGVPGHCSAGQKVTVNVLASTTGSSSPSPAPMQLSINVSGAGSTSPSPSGSTTPSSPSPTAGDMAPPSPNSAATVGGVSATAFLSVVAALLL